ncbi:MAG: ParB/RepB/Spo0J family partition protein [Acidobacteria bacterium]|jgi:ParB family chromosome partitioning protein|nr:MAG: ParB/RepB/Spo0J family partition protein [Acidobacteriota bacterium]GIU82370.1 MAG: chromosome partitioning protein ParB [Pyrinomonadaceae bacterium]
MVRKALGRGLSALIGGEISGVDREELLDIDIDLIEPNSEQPRTRFTEKELEELSQSIKANGIVQPIVVRRKGNGYQIVAGERRWKAAQIAGLSKVPAIVKDIPEEKLLELALVENIQRQELNPMEEARAYKKLIEKFGLTQENLAERIGKDRTVIATHLRLLKLPEGIQKLIEEGKITVGHAKAILAVDGSDLRWDLARKIVEQKLSVREAEKLARTLGRKKEAISIQRDANLEMAEVKLMRHLGTKVRIVPNRSGKGGKIEIDYYSETELDELYQRLMKC